MMHTGPIRAWLPGGRRMRTGPVSPILPPVVGAQPGPNGTIQAAAGDSFEWATVINPDPLTIQLDGQTTQLPGEPATLRVKQSLLPYMRVWVQRHGKRRIVIGAASFGWQNVTILDGFAARPNIPSSDFTPQVLLDSSGMVHFRGMMSNTGLTNMTSDTAILQLPDGYWPVAQQWWTGTSGTHTSVTYGGWVNPTDGQIYIRYDSTSPAPSPPSYFSLNVAAWMPVPAQPY